MSLTKLFSKEASIGLKALRMCVLAAAGIFGINSLINNLPEIESSEEQATTLKQLFKNSLDTDKISIKQSWFSDYLIDYSDAHTFGNTIHLHSRFTEKDQKALYNHILLHEHVHVWQKQNCAQESLSLIEMVQKYYLGKDKEHHSYGYHLEKQKDLLDYNTEQQAVIIADYAKFLNGENALHMLNDGYYREKNKQLFESVLANFLRNPSYIKAHCQNTPLVQAKI